MASKSSIEIAHSWPNTTRMQNAELITILFIVYGVIRVEFLTITKKGRNPCLL